MFVLESKRLSRGQVSRGQVSRRQVLHGAAAIAASAGLGSLTSPALAAEKITYLFPAPPLLPAFGPIQLAKGKGYFAQAGLEVSYAVGRGGVDVAKQVGAGNAPLGGIVADAPIVVRQNGVPVKIVCLFGGKGFMQLVVRKDSGIEKPADLKGKTITVMSYQDTTFYALLGLLASAGLYAGRRQYPGSGAGRRVADGGDRQVGRHGRSAGLDSARRGRRRRRQCAADRRIFPAYGASRRCFRSNHQGSAGTGALLRQGGVARHEGHHGRSPIKPLPIS